MHQSTASISAPNTFQGGWCLGYVDLEAISCWANGRFCGDRWTMPQTSVPGASCVIRAASLEILEGRTSEMIRIRVAITVSVLEDLRLF